MSNFRKLMCSYTTNKISAECSLTDTNMYWTSQTSSTSNKTTTYTYSDKSISFRFQKTSKDAYVKIRITLNGEKIVDTIFTVESFSSTTSLNSIFSLVLCNTRQVNYPYQYIIANTVSEFDSKLPLKFKLELESDEKITLLAHSFSEGTATKYFHKFIDTASIVGNCTIDENMYH